MAKKIIVLGGGLAGLSCAYDLAKAGHAVTLLEREEALGGLAKSFATDGYTYDLGPHRFYTKNPQVLAHLRELFAPGELLSSRRKSMIYMRGRFFAYPLEIGNVVRNLPPWTLARCFLDYGLECSRRAFRPSPDDNFESWTRSRFGKTLYDLFFGPYTSKAWGIPCTQISADWASQRISLLNLGHAVRKTATIALQRAASRALSREVSFGEPPRTYALEFFYPKTGGINEISRRYARAIERHGGRLVPGAVVRKIHHNGSQATEVWYDASGEARREAFDELVSTIPLTILPKLFNPEIPIDVTDAVRALWHKAIVFSYLVIKRPQLTDCHWIYLPEGHLTAHRICEFKNFSPEAAPPDRTILAVEITTNFDSDIWKMNAEQVAEITTRDLVTIGFIRPDEVERCYLQRVRYAYPMYDIVYKENLTRLLDYLDGYDNVITTGRQGLFKYNNMDGSIEMGMAAAEQITSGSSRDHRAIAAGSDYLG